ncbi:HNH endonuclease signature motif containing protein [Streptomyces sp. NPDC029004]|uniref:HNH endonuclease n=1 Tax=Streptomyces sp. NPDC029004 TaxID=3154490 RepID=UPI003402DE2D
MAQDRPKIPTPLRRKILQEAGHRCAIPACKQSPVEIAHIVPRRTVQEDVFENLIALCPTCHTRFDRGDIDTPSMREYKTNLETLNSRYTDIERQLLKSFRREWGEFSDIRFPIPEESVSFGEHLIHKGMNWMLANLLEDGLIELDAGAAERERNPDPEFLTIYLTRKGCEQMKRFYAGEPLDGQGIVLIAEATSAAEQ